MPALKHLEKPTEAMLLAVAKIYFEQQCWNLYPEVVIPCFNGRPDYVAIKGQLCAVIEGKTALNWSVVEQLARYRITFEQRIDWNKNSDRSKYLAMPHLLIAVTGSPKTYRNNDLRSHLINEYRIGHYEITCTFREYQPFPPSGNYPTLCENEVVYEGYIWRVYERIEPRIQPYSRKTAHSIIEQLNEDMKTAEAGTTSGGSNGYMTPFKRTMNRAKSVLEASQVDLHISEIVRRINKDHGGHHYASDSGAQRSIGKFLLDLDIAFNPVSGRYRLKR